MFTVTGGLWARCLSYEAVSLPWLTLGLMEEDQRLDVCQQ